MTGLPSCPCGAPAVAFKPGQDPVYAEVGFIVQRGRPTEGTCLACWPAAIGYQQEIFGRRPTLPGSERRAMEAVKALERDGLVKALYQTAGVFVQVTPEGWQEKPRYAGLGP